MPPCSLTWHRVNWHWALLAWSRLEKGSRAPESSGHNCPFHLFNPKPPEMLDSELEGLQVLALSSLPLSLNCYQSSVLVADLCVPLIGHFRLGR